MPIASYRHNLPKASDGSDWIIIRTPRPVSRIIENVRFTEGEGRTKYVGKAKMFDEVMGYLCILPVGHPGWTLVKHGNSSEPEQYEWENSYELVEEETGEEIEGLEQPNRRGKN